MRKILSFVMVIMMVLSLAACNSNSSESSTDTQATPTTAATDAEATAAVTQAADAGAAVDTIAGTYPEEKVLIGVEIYDPTESETLEMQSYFEYLAQTMNVEFKYSEAIADADGEMKFIEDCVIAGAKGFIGYYNVSGTQQVQSVIDYGMYYYGMADNTEIYDTFGTNPLYLGSVNLGNSEYEGGKAMGEWVLAQGYDTVIYANGGADFGVQLFINRQNGFLDALKDSSVKVITVSGFPGDQFFADQAAALSTEGLDAVCASFNGLDFWAQPIASTGLSETVKLATIGSVTQNFVDAFSSGTVSLLAATDIQRFGFGVGIICNAVDGNADALKVDGKATNAAEDIWIIQNSDDCKALYDVQVNEKVYSVEDIMSLSVKVNPNASATTIADLLAGATMESLLSK